MSQNHGPNLVTDGLLTCIDMANPGPKLINNFSGPDKYYEDRSGNGNHAVRGIQGGYQASYTFPGFWRNSASGGSLQFPLDFGSLARDLVNNDTYAQWTISLLLQRLADDGGVAPGLAPGSLGRLAGTNGIIDTGEIAIKKGTNDIWVNGPRSYWGDSDMDLIQNETAYICCGFNGPAANNFQGTEKYWKNGVLIKSFTTNVNTDGGNPTGYTMGSRSDFNGEWCETKFYHVTVHDRLLTDNEVAQNFEALRRRVNL